MKEDLGMAGTSRGRVLQCLRRRRRRRKNVPTAPVVTTRGQAVAQNPAMPVGGEQVSALSETPVTTPQPEPAMVATASKAPTAVGSKPTLAMRAAQSLKRTI